jgi:small subunit ribosomal protein S18
MAKQRKTRTRRREKKGGPGSTRRKPCPYCRDKIDQVDYKDVGALRRFISERGKIRSRRITGACRRHQSQIARAVKRTRELGLLPYTADHATTQRGGAPPERSERPERGERGERER